MTNPGKEATIRIPINYRCVPGKQQPAFAGLADLQDPPHKWHGFRILLITRRSVVSAPQGYRIHSPLLFPKRPEMVVFDLNMRLAPVFSCDLPFFDRITFYSFISVLLAQAISHAGRMAGSVNWISAPTFFQAGGSKYGTCISFV